MKCPALLTLLRDRKPQAVPSVRVKELEIATQRKDGFPAERKQPLEVSGPSLKVTKQDTGTLRSWLHPRLLHSWPLGPHCLLVLSTFIFPEHLHPFPCFLSLHRPEEGEPALYSAWVVTEPGFPETQEDVSAYWPQGLSLHEYS